ncbi:hypothetical protein E2C01_096788 [Portunus trituberculatus]|uniref:Uncharacterized protein n=1 Tax=Portunus trituberculatus TaxID=210409 RepID=A0A5B7K872_PORTR|nr:hypothetical protein [Portunus trituberculatus]
MQRCVRPSPPWTRPRRATWKSRTWRAS